MGTWCVYAVKEMAALFTNLDTFNDDISSWDVSSAKDMSAMFYQAESFNQDLSSWNVSQVTEMVEMFDGATSFNQDLSSWKISPSAIPAPKMFTGSGVDYSVACGWSDAWKSQLNCPTSSAASTTIAWLHPTALLVSASFAVCAFFM